MKNIIFVSLLLLLSSFGAHGSHTLEKKLTHRFDNANSYGTMNIDAKYSNVNIMQWDKPYAEITVVITARARNESSAQAVLRNLDASFREQGNSAFVKTVIKSDRGTSNRNEGFTMELQVNIPSGMKLVLDIKYGSVFTDDVDGDVNAVVKYGNFNARELKTHSNKLDIKYGNASIANAPEVHLTLGYGNFTAKNIGALFVNSKYSNIRADYIGATYIRSSSYDTYNIREAVNIESTTSTSGLEVGVLRGSLLLPGVKYGDVRVERVEAGFNKIDIKASYSKLNIGFSSPSFGYELETRYGNISLVEVDARTQIDLNGTTTTRVGKAGNYTGNTNVKITGNYSDIKLERAL